MTKPLILIVLLLGAAGANAQPLTMTGYDLDTASVRASPALLEKAKSMRPLLAAGLTRIASFFENPPIRSRTTFWLVSSDKEMKMIMTDVLRLPAAIADSSVKARVFTDGSNVVLTVDPAVQDDWLMRLMFCEHTRRVMDAVAPTAVDFRIGWFYNGLATYVGWLAQAEIDKKNPEDLEKNMVVYYARHFDMARLRKLEKLETPNDWARALKEDSSAVYAQAVVSVLYLCKTRGQRSGVLVLRIFNKEDAFGTAFERGAGIDLEKFESELREKYYPTIRAAIKQ